MRSPVRILLPTALLGAALAGCGSGSDGAADGAADGAPPSTPASSTAPAPEEPTSPGGKGADGDAGEQDGAAAEPAGRLVDWDDYEADPAAYADSDVVLFFHADWCHECQATDASLEADGIPDGLTLVKIDFDDRTDLRQRYGVTVQHTFVLVDGDGERQDIWTGTTSGADIAERAA